MEKRKLVFISQPMSGFSREQIKETREILCSKLENEKGWFIVNRELLRQPAFFVSCGMNDTTALYTLGQGIMSMAGCDIAYFCKGREEKRGCRIEHEVAKAYGIEIFYEE